MEIQKISAKCTNRICASQVVQGLTSSVKELVENSLDALASSVSVRIRNSAEEIEVADNGAGIPEVDWDKVCEVSSTSKLDEPSSSHLFTRFYGFRGEVLSSLCALSKSVRIVTRTKEMESGRILIYDNEGKLINKEERISKSVGTTVTVYGLFEDTLPVRFQDMRSNMRRELRAVQSIVTELCICHHNVTFELMANGRSLLTSPGGSSPYDVYEKLIGGHPLFRFKKGNDDMEVDGWGPPPERSTSSRCGKSFFFVNGRPQAPPKRLLKALTKAFDPHGIAGDMAPFILVVRFSGGGNFDRNVSVDKRIILFSSEIEDQLVQLCVDGYNEIVKAHASNVGRPSIHKLEFRSSLVKKEQEIEKCQKVPRLSLSSESLAYNPKPARECIGSNLRHNNQDEYHSRNLEIAVRDSSNDGLELLADVVLSEIPFSFCKELFLNMEIIGQFNNGFIITRLLSGNPQLFLVDQHAAHEKYLFEGYYRSMRVDVQTLIAPKCLSLGPALEETIFEYRSTLAENGFSVLFDSQAPPGNRVSITSLPTLSGIGFNRSAALTIEDFLEIVNLLEPDRPSPKYGKLSLLMLLKSVRAMFASKACRTAVMVGDSLTHSRMLEIVKGLATLESPWSCPHGRPTFKHLLSVDELRC
jgi:DNA mismatch repair protein MutL